MKKVLSLILCLLLAAALTVPVLATEDAWEFEMDVAEQAEETAPEIYYFAASGEEFIYDEDNNVYAIIGEDGVIAEKVLPYDEFYGVIDGEQATLVAPPTQAHSRLPVAILLVILLVVLIAGLGCLAIAAVVIIIVLIIVLVRKKKKKNAEEAPNAPSEEAPDTTSEE